MPRILLLIISFSLLSFSHITQAVCIKNETEFKLHYTIQNKNTGCPAPKVKYYEGYLSGKQKKCFAHSRAEGDDWKIFRFDIITIDKVDKQDSVPVCRKHVDGILNTLEVDYHPWNNKWWCLDDEDYED